MVSLTEHDNISRQTVRRRLAENELKPWRKDMWCIPKVDGEFVDCTAWSSITHASRLNMAELEIGVLRGQCLSRRIGECSKLVSEIAAWQKRRNNTKARIKWMFTTDTARDKLVRAYSNPINES